jgi:hypothetical protein
LEPALLSWVELGVLVAEDLGSLGPVFSLPLILFSVLMGRQAWLACTHLWP